MKKIISKVLIIILLGIAFIPKSAYAFTDICTKDDKNSLVKKASTIKVSYKPVKTDDNKYKFAIQILNMPNFTYAILDGTDIRIDNQDGASPISFPEFLNGNTSYKLKFYVLENLTCEDTLVFVKNFTLPKYNIYSETDECVEYEEFPLCAMYYTGEIKNYKEFKEKLEEYKEKLKPEEPEVEEEKTVLQKIVDFYTGNLIISIPVTVAVIGGIVFVLLKFVILKNKSKKIGIDDFIE